MDHPIIGATSARSGWLASPPGAYLLEWEQARFDHEVADVFGYHALQVGLSELDCLRANRMHCRVYARADDAPEPPDPARPAHEPAIRPAPKAVVRIEQPEELPFATQSLDLVALPHVLESAADPHEVLREVDRVLRPEGRLIVSGVNPVSLWGARHVLPGGLPAGLVPRDGRLIAAPRLRDWLRLLGFEPGHVRHGCYRPPARTRVWLDRAAFLEGAGDRWWPICGAVYLQCAVKRVRAMRLVGPAWKRSAPVRAPAVTASVRHSPASAGRRGVAGAGEPVSDTCIRETAAAD